jgi:hypothetical protein
MRYVILMTLLALSLFGAPTIAYGLLWLATIEQGHPWGSVVAAASGRRLREVPPVHRRASLPNRG